MKTWISLAEKLTIFRDILVRNGNSLSILSIYAYTTT